MKRKEVIVLGSGKTINNLTAEEVEYINNCEVVIAVNKFMAFYKKTGILPTHVFYTDAHEYGTKLFLNHLFEVCRKDKLKGITFVLGKSMQPSIYYNVVTYWLAKISSRLKAGLRSNHQSSFIYLAPSNRTNYFEYINRTSYLEGVVWAKNLNEVLFHYRGSLTTVLNYITIKYPTYKIGLIGNDFNDADYFFQEEIEKLNFEWRDYTYNLVKQEQKHFSAILHKNTTMFDKFEFIREKISEHGNQLYCTNPDSLLVTLGGVDYKSLIG